MTVDEAVEIIWSDLAAGRRPSTALRGRLTQADCYRVQYELLNRHRVAGARLTGWKIGGNSPAARAQFGLAQPLAGFLLDTGFRPSGAEINLADLPGSGVLECEIAVEFGARLAGVDLRHEEVGEAISAVRPAFEVACMGPPSAFDAGLSCTDNVAQWGYVLGPATLVERGFDLGGVEVTAHRDGVIVGQSVARESMDEPLDSLRWLAGHLSAYGLSIEPGHFVLTGAALKPEPLAARQHWNANFQGVGEVDVKITG